MKRFFGLVALGSLPTILVLGTTVLIYRAVTITLPMYFSWTAEPGVLGFAWAIILVIESIVVVAFGLGVVALLGLLVKREGTVSSVLRWLARLRLRISTAPKDC